MANITYAGDAGVSGWVNMAKKFEEAGADVVELNMCCPNMSYNLETTSGGSRHASKQTGASMGQHADESSRIVEAIKGAIGIPLFVKLTPEGGHIAQIAKALYEAGADAVGGTGNRLGIPPIDLNDPGKAFFHCKRRSAWAATAAAGSSRSRSGTPMKSARSAAMKESLRPRAALQTGRTRWR
jgi:dihydroorotate dehydrogenase